MLLENGLPLLLDVTRLQLLAAAALKNWVGDAVSRDPVSIKDRALLFLAAPAVEISALALWCGLV
jgi:hypothetical protein